MRTCILTLAVVLAALVERSQAITAYHRYEERVFVNLPVSTAKLQPLVHPDLSVDTHNGTGWVSVVISQLTKTSIDGVPVPFLKPFEVQVRTYVTDTENRAGVWLFDLFLSDPVTSLGAELIFELSIRCLQGDVRFDRGGDQWNATASELQVTARATADFSASFNVLPTPVTGAEFFTQRSAWFGARPLSGALVHSSLTNVSDQPPLAVYARYMSSSILQGLDLGPAFIQSACAVAPYACFYAGELDVTFLSPIAN